MRPSDPCPFREAYCSCCLNVERQSGESGGTASGLNSSLSWSLPVAIVAITMKRRAAGTTSLLTGLWSNLNVTYSFHLRLGCEARLNGLRRQSEYFEQKWCGVASPTTNSQKSLPRLVSSSHPQASE